jgi:hypothetical protein
MGKKQRALSPKEKALVAKIKALESSQFDLDKCEVLISKPTLMEVKIIIPPSKKQDGNVKIVISNIARQVMVIPEKMGGKDFADIITSILNGQEGFYAWRHPVQARTT